jgi:post-segregation antitoxin (ccd killing protein)
MANKKLEDILAATQIRLPAEVFAGLHQLKDAGYNMAAVMRQGIAKEVEEKLTELKARENDNKR